MKYFIKSLIERFCRDFTTGRSFDRQELASLVFETFQKLASQVFKTFLKNYS